MSINFLGFVQGRISKSPKNSLQHFPKNWKEEFKEAKKLNIKFIEFFSERQFKKQNPIWTNDGVKNYKSMLKKNSLSPYTFCDDFIISNCLKNIKTKKYLKKLIKQIKLLNIKYLILPMYGKSILNDKNYMSYAATLKELTFKKKINFLVESNISILQFEKLIKKIGNNNIFFLYDTGNRALLKNDPVKDILQLGKKNLKHIHIKDKNIKRENVKLGTGIAKFKKIFSALKKINYKGAYAFETTRGNNPVQTMIYNINFLKKHNK